MATVWKIAPGDKARVWGETSEQGCITINWMNQTNFMQFKTKEAVKNALKENGNGVNGADSIWYFVHDVQKGETVVANNGRSRVVGIGVVDSDYLPPDDPLNPRKTAEEHRHARRVNWVIKKPIDLHEQVFTPHIPPAVLQLNPEQCSKIKQAYLKEDSGLKDTLDKLFLPDPPSPRPTEATMKALLEQFGQMILYGPPGTGKTREAKRVALALLTGNESPENATSTDDEIEKQLKPFKGAGRFDLVVFHPAYEYEQFVGGIEPEPTGQQITFKAKAGVFTRLCRYVDAAKRSAVLIIDEINRGNLPKLLGELVYALEYRGHEVRLPFDDGRPNLTVPKNLYIVATMNSADRSIGHIDVAIRRRFGLYPLEPNADVVREVWSRVGDESYGDQLAGLMNQINLKLRSGHDAGAAAELGVGQSYFLPKPETPVEIAKEQVRVKWLYQVQPLLREYEQVLNSDAHSLEAYFKPLDKCLE